MINNHFNVNLTSQVHLTNNELKDAEQAIQYILNFIIKDRINAQLTLHISKCESVTHISSFQEDTNF